eukprot:Nitzschia sp. Nitz4//scaffold73_size107353//12168//12992//NITZ4_004307-RA/size107353-processed-gene-0.18-mRNA-1//-1//CDS//3329557437//2158//frame0
MLLHTNGHENTAPNSSTKNNEGVNLILDQDFESAIRCFQEALVWFKSELVLNQELPDGNPEPMGSKTVPFELVCTKPTGATTQEASETGCLKALLSPIRVLQPWFDSNETFTYSQREVHRNLSIAVTVLNAAISNHLLLLKGEEHGTVSQSVQESRRTKAKSLYDKVTEILLNSDPQDPEIKYLEAAFDLALLVSLNNSLVLEVFNRYTGENGEEKESNIRERTQLLAHAIFCGCSKVYSSVDAISRALSTYQEDSMTNILVMKSLRPKAAAAA